MARSTVLKISPQSCATHLLRCVRPLFASQARRTLDEAAGREKEGGNVGSALTTAGGAGGGS